jgi:diguanylate cyclase (GGDEF)-like protein
MHKAFDGEPQVFDWLAKAKKGRLFWVGMTLRRATLSGEDRLLLTARDIADRKRGESEQMLRTSRAEAQNEVSLALVAAGPNYLGAVELITRHLASRVGDLCVLRLAEADGSLRVAAMSQNYLGGDAVLPDREGMAPIPRGQAGEGRVAESGDPLLLSDASGKEVRPLLGGDLQEYAKRYGLHSLVSVAMRSEGRTVGTLSMAKGGGSRIYTLEDQAMLQGLADRAALTIINARLYEENLRQAEALKVANADLEQRVAERTLELEAAMARLEQLASSDGLTGLANRRHFDAVLDAELRRARRNGDPIAIILGDVDFFKRFNDHYGHPAGDACLQAVGGTMKEVFRRAGELPARYGGEEFVAILPGASEEAAVQAGEKFRKAVVDRALPHAKSEVATHVTVSLGVVSVPVTGEVDAEWLLTRADQALYRSKARGRNQVSTLS